MVQGRDVESIDVSLDWDKQRSLVEAVMNFRVPDWARNFLTSWETAAQNGFCFMELVNNSGLQCDELQTNFQNFGGGEDSKFQRNRQCAYL